MGVVSFPGHCHLQSLSVKFICKWGRPGNEAVGVAHTPVVTSLVDKAMLQIAPVQCYVIFIYHFAVHYGF